MSQIEAYCDKGHEGNTHANVIFHLPLAEVSITTSDVEGPLPCSRDTDAAKSSSCLIKEDDLYAEQYTSWQGYVRHSWKP